MSELFDDYLNQHIQSITSDRIINMDSLITDTLITLQMIIQQAEELKQQLANCKCIPKPTKLLLLSTKLDIVYEEFALIKQEYTP